MKSKQGCIQLIRLAIKVHFGAARKGKTGKESNTEDDGKVCRKNT